MKRFTTLLISVLITVAAFAYDFENTYFSSSWKVDGQTVGMVVAFKEGGKAIATFKFPGQKPITEVAGWEADSNVVYLIEGYEKHCFSIHYEWGVVNPQPTLWLDNPYGEDREFKMISEEAYKKECASTVPAKKSSKPTTRKKKRK